MSNSGHLKTDPSDTFVVNGSQQAGKSTGILRQLGTTSESKSSAHHDPSRLALRDRILSPIAPQNVEGFQLVLRPVAVVRPVGQGSYFLESQWGAKWSNKLTVWMPLMVCHSIF